MIKVLIIAAMYEELEPFLTLLGGHSLKKLPNKEEYYYKRTDKFGKEVELFCAVHPDYSKVSCACHTSRMMSAFNADIAIMIGICAGDEKKVNLGDVIVSKKLIDYETGKIENGEFYPEIKSYEVKNELKQFINRFIADDSFKVINNEIEYKSHFATIATGTKVIENETIFEDLRRFDRKVLGLDMEAYAFAEAVKGLNESSCILAVKSVCDFANSNKNDGYHTIAAENSSKWAYSFLTSFVTEKEFEYPEEKSVKYQIELKIPALTIDDRSQWYDVLKWDSESEKFIRDRLGDNSGITFYPLHDEKYLVEILTGLYAYQEGYCYYLVDLSDSTMTWKALIFINPVFPNDTPIYEVNIDESICGFANFDLNTMELSVYTKFRGLGDGKICTYKIHDNGSTELTEVKLITLNENAYSGDSLDEEAEIFNEPVVIDISGIDKVLLPLRYG